MVSTNHRKLTRALKSQNDSTVWISGRKEDNPVEDLQENPYPLFVVNFTEPSPASSQLRRVWTQGNSRFYENLRGEVYSSSLTELWQWHAYPENLAVPLCGLAKGLLELSYGDYDGPDFENISNGRYDSLHMLNGTQSLRKIKSQRVTEDRVRTGTYRTVLSKDRREKSVDDIRIRSSLSCFPARTMDSNSVHRNKNGTYENRDAGGISTDAHVQLLNEGTNNLNSLIQETLLGSLKQEAKPSGSDEGLEHSLRTASSELGGEVVCTPRDSTDVGVQQIDPREEETSESYCETKFGINHGTDEAKPGNAERLNDDKTQSIEGQLNTDSKLSEQDKESWVLLNTEPQSGNDSSREGIIKTEEDFVILSTPTQEDSSDGCKISNQGETSEQKQTGEVRSAGFIIGEPVVFPETIRQSETGDFQSSHRKTDGFDSQILKKLDFKYGPQFGASNRVDQPILSLSFDEKGSQSSNGNMCGFWTSADHKTVYVSAPSSVQNIDQKWNKCDTSVEQLSSDENSETKELLSETQAMPTEGQNWLSWTLTALWSYVPYIQVSTMACSWQNRSKVLDKLKESMKNKYWGQHKWSKFNDHPVSTLIDLRCYWKADETGMKVNSDEEIFDVNSVENIVITGGPSFGKTTLCALIKFSWVYSRKPSDHFHLCVYVALGNIGSTTDLEEDILSILYQGSDHVHSPEEIRDALENSETKILLILDDLDKLSPSCTPAFQRFLYKRNLFRNATVVVTTRPTCRSTVGSFDKRFEIRGLSADYLFSTLERTVRDKYLLEDLKQNIVKDKKMIHLAGMPPFIVDCVAKILSRQQNPSTLHDMMKCIIEALAIKHLQNPRGFTYENLFAEKGKVFYDALVLGKYSFTEQLLVQTFGDQFHFLMKCRFFYEDSLNDVSCWTVCHKLFMIFFATEYLRGAWKGLTDDHKRWDFLQNVFCAGDSFGDYVVGDGDKPHLYYVGVVPEIVLKLVHPYRIADSSFEMIYDVENVEKSRSFDSLNMLLRFSSKHLDRYNFVELDAGECSERFEKLLNIMNFDNCCVDYKLFHNDYEGTDFVKIKVANPDEEGDLLVLCRMNSNGQYDRMHIDFDVRMLADVFDFLVWSWGFWVNMELPLEGPIPYDQFVHYLVLSFLETDRLRSASVTCFSDNEHSSNSVSFKVTKQHVEVVSLFTEKGSCTRYVYNSATFRAIAKRVRDSILAIGKPDEVIRICINL